MSKMSNHALNTTDDRARDDAEEVARLRAIIAEAAALLDEGDPAALLDEIASRIEGNYPELAEVTLCIAATIRKAAEVLGR